jgi:hypothetical protein
MSVADDVARWYVTCALAFYRHSMSHLCRSVSMPPQASVLLPSTTTTMTTTTDATGDDRKPTRYVLSLMSCPIMRSHSDGDRAARLTEAARTIARMSTQFPDSSTDAADTSPRAGDRTSVSPRSAQPGDARDGTHHTRRCDPVHSEQIEHFTASQCVADLATSRLGDLSARERRAVGERSQHCCTD